MQLAGEVYSKTFVLRRKLSILNATKEPDKGMLY